MNPQFSEKIGHRFGGDVFLLEDGHIDQLLSAGTIALDVQRRFVVFLKYKGTCASQNL